MTVETVGHGDNLPVHLAIYGVPRDGYIMVIDGKGHTDYAYFGDLMMAATEASGYLGVIVDGCARDYLGLVKLGFPVFCMGYMASAGLKKEPGNLNVPITCGGVKVSPGDLVIGDADGVAVVPRDRIIEVLEHAEKKAAYEDKRVETIVAFREAKAAGLPRPELAPYWILDMEKAIEKEPAAVK
jgi:regulator of RNase E activity RraA